MTSRLLTLLMMTIGGSRSFQLEIKPMMVQIAIAGLPIGIIIWRIFRK